MSSLIIALLALAVAQPAVPGRPERAWESAPDPAMVRIGGNGPGRAHYVLPEENLEFPGFYVSSIAYEYIGGRLGTVSLGLDRPTDAAAAAAWLSETRGIPQFESDDLRVWRTEDLRVVFRRHASDRWLVLFAWLPLHGTDPADPARGDLDPARDLRLQTRPGELP